MSKNDKTITINLSEFYRNVKEEAPTNAVGHGAVDGIGIGDKGEPPVSFAMLKRYRRKNKKQANNHSQKHK